MVPHVARHPIDIIVASPVLNRLNSLYYYNPFEHSLNQLNLLKSYTDDFINHINSVLNTENSTIIWFIAHPNRTDAKYNNSASLIWRDAGALINCIQLVCTALNIDSCPIGSLGEPFISQMFAANGNVFGVGGILIG